MPVQTTRGSSPRVRGTRGINPGEFPVDRFIPACAGNTSSYFLSFTASWVHPRVCGEHGSRRSGPAALTGSSPRVRGTHDLHIDDTVSLRFIPACAGNTRPRSSAHPGRPVHPRVCGEHCRDDGPLPADAGSSPRVRGTQKSRHHANRSLRFIPACAGNTCLSRSLLP